MVSTKELQKMTVHIFWICYCVKYTFEVRLDSVAHTYNPSYLAIGYQEDCHLRPSKPKVNDTPSQKKKLGWWFTPVIPAILEVSQSEANPGKKCETQSEKIAKAKCSGGVDEVGEHLLSKCDILS
jgi:hypothetical protein